MESAITSKGQTTIPKAIRDHLGLRPGDRVKFFVQADGRVLLLPRISVTAMRGMLKHSAKPVTLEEMDEAIAQGAAKQSRAGRSR